MHSFGTIWHDVYRERFDIRFRDFALFEESSVERPGIAIALISDRSCPPDDLRAVLCDKRMRSIHRCVILSGDFEQMRLEGGNRCCLCQGLHAPHPEDAGAEIPVGVDLSPRHCTALYMCRDDCRVAQMLFPLVPSPTRHGSGEPVDGPTSPPSTSTPELAIALI